MKPPSAPSPPLHGLEVVVVVAGDRLLLLPPLRPEPGLQKVVENVQGAGPLSRHLSVLTARPGVTVGTHAATRAEYALAVPLHAAVQTTERAPAHPEALHPGWGEKRQHQQDRGELCEGSGQHRVGPGVEQEAKSPAHHVQKDHGCVTVCV